MKIIYTMRFSFALVLLIPIFGISQINDQNIRIKALKKGLIGKELVFGKWNEKGKTETHLTYLGTVKTNQGKTYKILNSIWIWGLSHRATNRILIFNANNQYLGNYYVTLNIDLPTKLKNRILIFQNTDSNCSKNVASKISLKNGLPKEFFRECKDGYGDIYAFDGIN